MSPFDSAAFSEGTGLTHVLVDFNFNPLNARIRQNELWRATARPDAAMAGALEDAARGPLCAPSRRGRAARFVAIHYHVSRSARSLGRLREGYFDPRLIADPAA